MGSPTVPSSRSDVKSCFSGYSGPHRENARMAVGAVYKMVALYRPEHHGVGPRSGRTPALPQITPERDGHPVAPLHTEPVQGIGEPAHVLEQLPVRDGPLLAWLPLPVIGGDLVPAARSTWRSRQLYGALSVPPVNHLTHGGDHSMTVSNFSNEVRRSAYAAQNPSTSASARS